MCGTNGCLVDKRSVSGNVSSPRPRRELQGDQGVQDGRRDDRVDLVMPLPISDGLTSARK